MRDDEAKPLEEELKRGEGAYVEFKPPTLDMSEVGDGMAKVLRAIIAFSSTPGAEKCQVYLGVIEGEKQRDMIVDALRAVERFRELRGQPTLSTSEKDAWKDWIREASFVGHNKTHIVVMNHPESFGPKTNGFTEQLKKFAKLAPPQGQFELKRIRSSFRKPDPDNCEEQWALRITLPAAGKNPNQAVSLRDMGGVDGDLIPLVSGCWSR